MRARYITTMAALLITAALVLPALGQQSPWAQSPGSFLNGTPKPIVFKPITLPKPPPAPKTPSPTPAPSTSFFSLSRVYPKISLGAWPAKSAKTPPGPQILGPASRAP